MTKCQVYVGMALTEAPEEFREGFQEELKAGLRTIPSVVVLDFVGLTAGDDVDVFEHDKQCTFEADLCLFVVDHPSIGLGMEIAFRYLSRRPYVVFARHGKRVTRMLTGAMKYQREEVRRYDTVADIVAVIRQMLP